MKLLNIAIAGVTLAIAAPAAAQFVTDGDQFVEAVQKRDISKANDILQKHPNIVDTKNVKGDTGLLITLRAKDREWTGFLLNNGANPNQQGANGETPLIAAARAGFDEAVGWLIGLGAKVDGTNKSGETPLIVAVQLRNREMVKALLEAGADPDRTDAVAGYSARDYARRDTRAREIQRLIDTTKPKSGAAK